MCCIPALTAMGTAVMAADMRPSHILMLVFMAVWLYRVSITCAETPTATVAMTSNAIAFLAVVFAFMVIEFLVLI